MIEFAVAIAVIALLIGVVLALTRSDVETERFMAEQDLRRIKRRTMTDMYAAEREAGREDVIEGTAVEITRR